MSLAATLLVWQVHGSLIASLDSAVIGKVQAVADQAEHSNLPPRLDDAGDGAPMVQVVDEHGTLIAASGGLEHAPRLFTVAGAEDPHLATVTETADWDKDGDGDTAYRVAALNVDGHQGRLTVYAALSTDSVSDSVTELTAALAIGVPLVVAVLSLISWLLVGGALRPVEAMRRQAAAIPATDLHQRLPTPITHDELGRLATTLNELLTRIEAANDRQRQFIADAAHELRSPLASLRAQLELAARQPPRAGDASGIAGQLADTERLSRLVDDLLALARLDANPPPHRQAVDLDDLVLQEARQVRGRGITIDTTAVSAGQVTGDPAGLSRVVRNLLDNAARHAATTVTATLHERDGQVTLVIADDGPGIPLSDRERVFERFTRLDDARSHDAGGAGLGLAIVRDVVLNHGGTVRIDDNHPGARFTITLPAND